MESVTYRIRHPAPDGISHSQDKTPCKLWDQSLIGEDTLWEVLMLLDSEEAAWVSGAAETADYFG